MMENILPIAGGVALLALAGLLVAMIVLVRRMTAKVEMLLDTTNGVVKQISGEIQPLVRQVERTADSLQGITGQLEGTITQVNRAMGEVDGIISGVKGMVHSVERVTEQASNVVVNAGNVVNNTVHFLDRVQTSVQQPVLEISRFFSAIGRGIGTFRRKLGGAE